MENYPVGRSDRTLTHYILSSPIYPRRIPHKGEIYEGQHPAIIEPKGWQRVQDQLHSKSPMREPPTTRKTKASPLLGKLFDENHERLSPSHSRKKGRRYQYYISRGYVTGRKDSFKGRGWCLPAEQLEQAMVQAIRAHLSGSATADLAQDARVETLNCMKGIRHLEQNQVLELLSRAILKEGTLSLQLDAGVLAKTLKTDSDRLNSDLLGFDVPFANRRRGVETRLVTAGASVTPDDTLITNIARAHDWLRRIRFGETLDEIASAEQTTKKRVQQVIGFAFLAPDIVREILTGKQPLGLISTWFATHTIPFDWTEQRALLS